MATNWPANPAEMWFCRKIDQLVGGKEGSSDYTDESKIRPI